MTRFVRKANSVPITRSRTIDVERSTTGDERQTRRGEEKSTGATLAIRLADRLSVICRAIIGRSFAEAALFSAWLYEIASLPRGVITKNQAKRPKSHHRASTLFLQFWRGAIDTHAGPLFARLSSRRSSSPPPPSLSVSCSYAVSIPPRRSRAENTWEGKEFSVVGFVRSLR